MKNIRKNKTNPDQPTFARYLTLFGAIIIIIVVANIISFLSPDADQFNVFYKLTPYYSIADWNLPHIVDVDVDGDGIKDKFIYDGCIFLSASNSASIASTKTCYNNLVNEGKTKGLRAIEYVDGEKRSSKQMVSLYLGKTKKGAWNIVLNRNGNTKLYEINPQGVVEINPPLALKIDSILYFLSHIFALVI